MITEARQWVGSRIKSETSDVADLGAYLVIEWTVAL
jgi:hypothetical protein